MNPLELLKALEAIRDKAAHACADITASLPPNDLRDYLTKAHYGAFATKFTAPFVIHTIAHAACEAAYADMEAEARASEGIPV